MRPAIFYLGLLALPSVALAQEAPAVLGHFAGEPSVAALQAAATRLAAVEPARVRSWQKRARTAAALPTVRARIGRGSTGVLITRGVDGTDNFSTVENSAWHFDVEATWALDRLIFDPNEVRVSREAQRVAARREQLLTQVAQLYYARRRLQVDQLLDPDAHADLALDRALAIDELTAILDGLTGGALSNGKP
jgi:hypothetical protein